MDASADPLDAATGAAEMTATPSDKSDSNAALRGWQAAIRETSTCTENAETYTRQTERVKGEPPQRRAVELPDHGFTYEYTGDTIVCALASAITYAEQVAAERCAGLREASCEVIMVLSNKLDAEKQRADSLAVRVRELEAFHAYFHGRCEELFFLFGMEPVDLFNAAILAESEGKDSP